MLIHRKRFFVILGIILGLLLIPLTAMKFSNEVNWSAFDFLIMGILFLAIGVIFEIIKNKIKKKSTKIVLIVILFLLFLLTWLELAVGIFGTPFAGN